jgi:predicted transcriptional regulator
MIKLLEDAIAKVRELPEAAQQEAAEILLSVASKAAEPIRLDAETRAAVRRGLAEAERGELVPDEIVAEANKRHLAISRSSAFGSSWKRAMKSLATSPG